MNRNTHAESRPPTDRDACKCCRDEAIVKVVRTAIDGASHPIRKSSPAVAALCQDCFARLRANPDTSFGTLFEDAADDSNQYIKVERV